MNVFSIRDIENLTGIKAHTLRIWEQRHHLFSPKRKESKHRFYDCDDLKYILQIAHLYKHGYKISRIASLSQEEVRRLALELQPGSDNFGIYINQLSEAALDFDQLRFEKVLDQLVDRAGFERSMVHVIFPLLNRIGSLWLAGKMHTCQEHFASALIVHRMTMAVDALERPAPSGKRKVLLFTPEAEFHEIPILFMQYLLRKHGVPYIYLGHNVSFDTLRTVCRQVPVTQLYFHLITNLTGCDIHQYLLKLSEAFPGKEVVFSCSMHCQDARLPGNVRALRKTEEMLAFSE